MENNAKLAVLIETKVKMENCAAVFDPFIPNWRYFHNGEGGSTARIWVGWDATIFEVEEMQNSNQFIHMKVRTLGSSLSFMCTAVYASNSVEERRDLWRDVIDFGSNISSPWIAMGNFNIVSQQSEKLGGDLVRQETVDEFNSFIFDTGLIDLKWKGEQCTWNNRQGGSSRVCCKLDRVMVNLNWLDILRSLEATFLPPGLSNHSPAVVSIFDGVNFGPKPFRFFEAWIGREGFDEVVIKGWDCPVNLKLNPILRFAAPLKNVKAELKNWNKCSVGDVFLAVKNASLELAHIQLSLAAQPNDPSLVPLETAAKKKLWEALVIEEKFLKEKSRVKNIQLGDGNNGFFHKSMVCRQNRNHILEVHNAENEVIKEPNLIKKEAVSFYMNLFGVEVEDVGYFPGSIPLRHGLDLVQQNSLIGQVSNKEIRDVLFSMKNSKAPGPDGFWSNLFQACLGGCW
ncbi:uncharacterized protein LOC122647977 [Telopea speciosissima]|uniref:uncharacterized protein LOC122647977 n=1 Tax=Telopea speciosissima TaxID=54955 RepID=UPI001CC81EEC|nr:uncharacterized protein LOC122647977 [Telopea speciosissima]